MSADRRPHVLFVDHVQRILGGAEVNLIELLAESGTGCDWRITVACHPEGRLDEALAGQGIERRAHGFEDALGTLRLVGHRFPLWGALRGLRALARCRRELATLLREVRPDAVISCTNKDHFAAWPACRAAGIPSVWWVNDIVSAEFFPWMARRAFLTQARRGARRLVVVSDFARRVLVDAGLADGRVVTIHNGIPLERYRRHPRGTLRRLIAAGDSEPVMGIVGRVTPWKGQEFFVRLAEAWCRENAAGRFVLLGHAFNEDQAFEHRLREFVRDRRLRERVSFIPFQREVAAALSDLDVMVHASLKPEPFGRVIIEAMAVGVPVLAANAGGVPEIVTHGRNGYLARPGEIGEYLAGLRALIHDPALRERVAREARETVLARFTVRRVREEFEALVAGVC